MARKVAVIPAQAGIHVSQSYPDRTWIPAFAGMTIVWVVARAGMTYGLDPRFRGDDLLGVQFPLPASCFLSPVFLQFLNPAP